MVKIFQNLKNIPTDPVSSTNRVEDHSKTTPQHTMVYHNLKNKQKRNNPKTIPLVYHKLLKINDKEKILKNIQRKKYIIHQRTMIKYITASHLKQ